MKTTIDKVVRKKKTLKLDKKKIINTCSKTTKINKKTY